MMMIKNTTKLHKKKQPERRNPSNESTILTTANVLPQHSRRSRSRGQRKCRANATNFIPKEIHTHTQRERERETDRQTDRQTHRHRHTYT